MPSYMFQDHTLFMQNNCNGGFVSVKSNENGEMELSSPLARFVLPSMIYERAEKLKSFSNALW